MIVHFVFFIFIGNTSEALKTVLLFHLISIQLLWVTFANISWRIIFHVERISSLSLAAQFAHEFICICTALSKSELIEAYWKINQLVRGREINSCALCWVWIYHFQWLSKQKKPATEYSTFHISLFNIGYFRLFWPNVNHRHQISTEVPI